MSKSEESDSDIIGSSQDSGNKPHSSYFRTNVRIFSKRVEGVDNESTSLDRRSENSGESLSGRKVFVTLNSRRHGRDNEIRVTSGANAVKKIDSSTQSDRNIVGQEGSPKERKKWARPPLVGQASLSSAQAARDRSSSSTASDSESHSDTKNSGASAYFTIHETNRKDEKEAVEPENRASPVSTSSLTSGKPLEWDSGADVGYYNGNKDYRLSTLEKLALSQGSVSIFTRSDPEGTSGNKVPSKGFKIAAPTAESTLKPSHDSKDKGYPLYPTIKVNSVQASDSSEPEERSRCLPDEGQVKKSSSMEEVSQPQQAFPRSHSQSNLNEERPHRIDSAKSHSSSSLSTVINKRNPPKKRSIFVQTGVCSEVSDTGGGGDVQNVKSPTATDQFNTLESGVLAGDARANSFEYLPGHVYENAVANKTSTTSGSLQDVHEDVWKESSCSSLKEDIERGVNLLTEFVRNSKAQDDKKKKELVHKVVEKIIGAKYESDEESSKRASYREELALEVRGQVSGESSTDKDKSPRSPFKSDKCVGTGVSTSLSGCTESESWQSNSKCPQTSSGHKPTSNHRHRKATNGASSEYPRSSEIHQLLKQLKLDLPQVKQGKKELQEELLMKYLQKERQHQINWIRSEINHLSNLKNLLEKHETLKQNLATLKKNNKQLAKPLKSACERLESRKLKSNRGRERVTGLQPDEADLQSEASLPSTTSYRDPPHHQASGWTSHHYESEDEERKQCRPVHPTAYHLVFDNKSPRVIRSEGKVSGSRREEGRGRGRDMLSVEELKTAIDQIVERHRQPSPRLLLPQPSLRDYLESGRPDYVNRAEARRQVLADITELRQARHAVRTKLITEDPSLPPPPLSVKRLFSQKNLRKQTEHRYRQLEEVKSKKAELKRSEQYRTNRLMAQMFTRKLQKKTLKGEVNLSNSVCVIAAS